MAMTLQVLYPIAEGTTFDYDYYLDSHVPIVGEHFGAHFSSATASKGLAGGPDSPPGFYAIATLRFETEAAMNSALAAAEPVLADIPKFTNTQPQMLIGEVIL